MHIRNSVLSLEQQGRTELGVLQVLQLAAGRDAVQRAEALLLAGGGGGALLQPGMRLLPLAHGVVQVAAGGGAQHGPRAPRGRLGGAAPGGVRAAKLGLGHCARGRLLLLWLRPLVGLRPMQHCVLALGCVTHCFRTLHHGKRLTRDGRCLQDGMVLGPACFVVRKAMVAMYHWPAL